MAEIQRRAFVKGAALGAFAFTVGGSTVMLTPARARAENVPFRLLNRAEADAIEAVGDTLVPGARAAGIAHFIDQQTACPPEEALLALRIANGRPPYINFYRVALKAIDGASSKAFGKTFAALAAADQRSVVDAMRTNKAEAWQGPPGPFVYNIFRSDAVDVVYGTMEGYEALGVPYMPHIAPDKRW